VILFSFFLELKVFLVLLLIVLGVFLILLLWLFLVVFHFRKEGGLRLLRG